MKLHATVILTFFARGSAAEVHNNQFAPEYRLGEDRKKEHRKMQDVFVAVVKVEVAATGYFVYNVRKKRQTIKKDIISYYE